MSRGKIACKACHNCGPSAKKKWDGTSGEIRGPVPGHPDLVDIKGDGDRGNETRWCPKPNVLPGDAPVVDTTKPEEPPPPPPKPDPAPEKFVDFGYGPVCARCRAGRGEGHSSDCPSCPNK